MDSKIERIVSIEQKQSQKDIILTSRYDSEALILMIPIDIEIANVSSEYEVLSYWFKMYNCKTLNERLKEYVTYFETDSLKFGYAYGDLPKLKPKDKILVTAYSFHYIYPKKDTLASHKDFNKEYNFIKKNCTEGNNYKNDTIRYSNFAELISKKPLYTKETLLDYCDEIRFANSYYNRKENYMQSEKIALDIKYN